MGIDYSGGMLVGEDFKKVTIPESWDGDDYEWLEEQGMDRYSPWYDADMEYCTVGFTVADIPVSDIDEDWLADIRKKAKEFEELTGTPARLIGMQDIW